MLYSAAQKAARNCHFTLLFIDLLLGEIYNFKVGNDAQYQVGSYNNEGQIIVDGNHVKLVNVPIQDI